MVLVQRFTKTVPLSMHETALPVFPGARVCLRTTRKNGNALLYAYLDQPTIRVLNRDLSTKLPY